MIIRDFNVILDLHELGPISYKLFCKKFQSTVDSFRLIQIDAKGTFFTWARCGLRGYTASKLDRTFSNSEGANFWDSTNCLAMPRHHSNLTPLR